MSGQDIKDFLPEEDTCQLCICQFYDFHFKLRLLKVAGSLFYCVKIMRFI